MLPPEPAVIAGRMDLLDAQASPYFSGVAKAIGNYWVSWYGTTVSDERGSFAVVNPAGGLASAVGDFLRVVYRGRYVNVYVIGSYESLTTDLALSRRAYLAVCRLSLDPIYTPVERLT